MSISINVEAVCKTSCFLENLASVMELERKMVYSGERFILFLQFANSEINPF